MKIISLQDIKEAFIRIKSLIGETLTSTVDAITEVENKIPKKVSQLENDTGFITDSEANTTYALSKSNATITLTGSDGSEYSETFTKSDIGLSNVPNVSTNNQVPTFSQASSRINIASGETLAVILGKIMRYFADLKGVAFSGSYNDLSSRPSLFSGSYNDLSNKPSLFSGNYNDLTNKPAIPSVGNGTLTIQRNGTKVQTFSANQSTAATANITVPNVSDSSSVTQTGTYALDAVEKNASVSGTLANAISQINSNLKDIFKIITFTSSKSSVPAKSYKSFTISLNVPSGYIPAWFRRVSMNGAACGIMGYALSQQSSGAYIIVAAVVNPFENATTSSYYMYGEVVCVKSSLY